MKHEAIKDLKEAGKGLVIAESQLQEMRRHTTALERQVEELAFLVFNLCEQAAAPDATKTEEALKAAVTRTDEVCEGFHDLQDELAKIAAKATMVRQTLIKTWKRKLLA
jgi:hypothetical protein